MHIVTNERMHGIENRTDINDGISEIKPKVLIYGAYNKPFLDGLVKSL